MASPAAQHRPDDPERHRRPAGGGPAGAAAVAESAAGTGLAAPLGLLAKLRRDKPIHSRGIVVDATLSRTGSPHRFGVPWLDEPGEDSGIVRLSRSVGLPAPAPDVLGLAIRVGDHDDPHDLLLATTGMSPGLRHVLVPRRDPLRASYGSLFPYDAAGQWVVLAAVPDAAVEAGRAWSLSEALAREEHAFHLMVATPLGAWERFARLTLTGRTGEQDDVAVDFDPVCHPLPGLPIAAPFRRLREPAYAAARLARTR